MLIVDVVGNTDTLNEEDKAVSHRHLKVVALDMRIEPLLVLCTQHFL